MKAEELRIGSLLYITDKQREELFDSEINTTNNYVSVTNISIDNCLEVYIDSNILEYDLNELKPIPLTEEWLVKFGFEKSFGSRFWRKGMCISLEEWGDEKGNEGEGFFFMMGDLGMRDVHIKHVHQLQNLCYALFREELKCK